MRAPETISAARPFPNFAYEIMATLFHAYIVIYIYIGPMNRFVFDGGGFVQVGSIYY